MNHMKIEGPSGLPTSRRYETVAVLGAGSWGTALAATLARSGSRVRLWGRDAAVISDIIRNRENSRHLPDVPLPEGLLGVKEMRDALSGADAALIVVPSRSVRNVARQAAKFADAKLPVAVCAKGIEAETGLLMAQVAEEELPGRPVGVVSGPTFARETALNHPTAATVSFPFRPADRLDPGESPAVRLALAEALGGRRETVTGLSGIGDLTLTCSSPTSRNMSLGTQLGQGIPREKCFDGKPVVVEGEMNAKTVTDLARRVGVSMPICEAVNAILRDGAALGPTFAALWARPIEAEPRAMDLAFDHPANNKSIQQLAERIS